MAKLFIPACNNGLQIILMTRSEITDLIKTLSEQLSTNGCGHLSVPDEVPIFQVRGGTEAVTSCAIVLEYEPTQFELWCKRFESVLYGYASWFMGARVEGNKYIVYTTSKQRAERDLDKLPEFSDWRDHVRLVRQGKIIPL